MNSIRNFFTDLKKDFDDMSDLMDKIIYTDYSKKNKQYNISKDDNRKQLE